MEEKTKSEDLNWPGLLQRVTAEINGLSAGDRQWLTLRLQSIAVLQTDLDRLFHKAGGALACADCDGECCGCGRHHFTLTNLLSYLLSGEAAPTPEFSNTCPFLGEDGCCLPVARRPYNCITFFCERLEDRLNLDDQQALRALDRRLRKEYQAVADRYPAASLRGLWIAMERIGQGQILG